MPTSIFLPTTRADRVQVSERKPNIVLTSTLKIAKEAHDWLRDEQTRLRKIEGSEPTHAELFDRMRAVYKEHEGDDAQASGDDLTARSPTEKKVIRLLRIPEQDRAPEEQFAVGMIVDLLRRLDERPK